MAIRSRHLLAVVSAVALSLTPAATASAGTRTTLNDVEDEVMCPVCGTPLNLATESPQAERERRLISRRIAQCRSKDQIKDELAAQFGDEVLALPEDRGFDLAAYIVPAIGALLGLGLITVATLRWRRGRSAPAPVAVEGEDSKRLDADLERYEL
jgi:cytochrome c-type biogenesis protein CcmH/NrfF